MINIVDEISLAILGTLLGGIIIIRKKGFNEILKDLESIDHYSVKVLQRFDNDKSKIK